MRSVPTTALVAGLMAGLALLAAGCGSAADGDPSAEEQVVNVFAAASLTDAFQQLTFAFEEANPGFDVRLNLAGSSSLRAQILSGAPADVFASANQAVMDEVDRSEALVGAPQVFATNRLQIAVPAGNPGNLSGLDDFARSELFLGLCAETVPCGSFADATLSAAEVRPSVDTREPDVRALLSKVADGELDGGIVYATDVLASDRDVEGIDIPAEFALVAPYPIAVVDQSRSSDVGQAFMDFVLGPDGQAILAENGFGRP